MKRLIRFYVLLLSTVLVLGGCTSMTVEECKIARWNDVGLRDGMAGEPLSKLTDLSKDRASPGHGRYPGLSGRARSGSATIARCPMRRASGWPEILPGSVRWRLTANSGAVSKLAKRCMTRVSGAQPGQPPLDLENRLRNAGNDEARKKLRDDLSDNDRNLRRARDRVRDAEYNLDRLR
jgi:hypothetical protein